VEKAPRRNRTASQAIRYRLGDNIKRFRRARGYTQKELAEVCQVHKNYVSNVEQGTVNISLANLEALATGLVCTEWELLR
jgi:transcriptional regulator with XRE-family HTH domain